MTPGLSGGFLPGSLSQEHNTADGHASMFVATIMPICEKMATILNYFFRYLQMYYFGCIWEVIFK